MDVTIRRAEKADASDLVDLITALADFEHLPAPDDAARARLAADGFGDHPRFETWLAFVPNRPKPVAYAILFDTYSTFLARPTLYLEDLFVLPEFRRQGIGSRMLRQFIQTAHERGCGRMEWACLDWNIKAQGVYEALGARHLKEWFSYRLNRDAMRQFLER
jgi:GNAT superfamily N-acetyltransferase